MAINVEFNDREVRILIQALSFESNSRTEIFRDISFLIENDIKDIIGSRKVDSQGRPWERWTPSYARRQARRGRFQPRNTLLDTGTLRSSIQSDFDSEELNVGTNLEYAETHNEGDPSRNIVDREFLYVDDSLTEDILDIVELELERVAGRF